MIDEIWDYLRAWVHRKEAEKFTTDGDGNTAVRVKGNLEVTTTNSPNTEEVMIINIPLANVETPITLPNGTKRYRIKARGGKGPMNLAYNVGETSNLYYSISRGSSYDSDDMDLPDGYTIYLSSSSSNIDIEVRIQKRV